MNSCKVGSIHQIYTRLREAGYNVSEYTLRLWIRNGTLHAVWTGNKALISFDNVVALLEGHDQTPLSIA